MDKLSEASCVACVEKMCSRSVEKIYKYINKKISLPLLGSSDRELIIESLEE